MKHIIKYKLFEGLEEDYFAFNSKGSTPSSYEYNDKNIVLVQSPGMMNYTRVSIRNLKDEELGNFNIALAGYVPIDPDGHFDEIDIINSGFEVDQEFPHSIYLSGGFNVKPEEERKGVGTAAIKKLFIDYPHLENIFLYAVPWQNAIPFWHKLGGESIIEVNNDKKNSHYIQLQRHNALTK